MIEYDELPPVTVKGKAEPVPLWRAVSARSRFGVDVDAAPTPFVDETAASAYAEAAEGWERFGCVLEHALARDAQSRCLTALGQGRDAVVARESADEIFRRLGVRPPDQTAARTAK